MVLNISKLKMCFCLLNVSHYSILYYSIQLFQGDFQQYVDLFERGLGPCGSYWHHLLGGWRITDRSNVKFIWFEEMKVDQKKVIQELCDFLDHPLSEEKVIE